MGPTRKSSFQTVGDKHAGECEPTMSHMLKAKNIIGKLWYELKLDLSSKLLKHHDFLKCGNHTH